MFPKFNRYNRFEIQNFFQYSVSAKLGKRRERARYKEETN